MTREIGRNAKEKIANVHERTGSLLSVCLGYVDNSCSFSLSLSHKMYLGEKSLLLLLQLLISLGMD